MPMNARADLSVVGRARLISDFLDGLELEGVTLVGNNTGGRSVRSSLPLIRRGSDASC